MKKSPNEGVYICLEGLKGAGKTTVFDLLLKKMEQNNIDFTTVAPTKMSEKSNFFERKLIKNPQLKESRFFRIFLYAQRSNYAAKNAQWNKQLILGERSLMTSYATKWEESKFKTWWNISVINLFERKIRAPDFVIYIDVPHDVLNLRIENRKKERDIDDTPVRLVQMEEAYKKLSEKKIPRISKTEWQIVSGNQPLEAVVESVYEAVMKIKQA